MTPQPAGGGAVPIEFYPRYRTLLLDRGFLLDLYDATRYRRVRVLPDGRIEGMEAGSTTGRRRRRRRG